MYQNCAPDFWISSRQALYSASINQSDRKPLTNRFPELLHSHVYFIQPNPPSDDVGQIYAI